MLDLSRHQRPMDASFPEKLHASAEFPKRNPMQRASSFSNREIGFPFDGDRDDRYLATFGFFENEERKPAAAGNEPDMLGTLLTIHGDSAAKKRAANALK
jgi:hypothetical protein